MLPRYNCFIVSQRAVHPLYTHKARYIDGDDDNDDNDENHDDNEDIN